jgi:hypothetical protein
VARWHFPFHRDQCIGDGAAFALLVRRRILQKPRHRPVLVAVKHLLELEIGAGKGLFNQGLKRIGHGIASLNLMGLAARVKRPESVLHANATIRQKLRPERIS